MYDARTFAAFTACCSTQPAVALLIKQAHLSHQKHHNTQQKNTKKTLSVEERPSPPHPCPMRSPPQNAAPDAATLADCKTHVNHASIPPASTAHTSAPQACHQNHCIINTQLHMLVPCITCVFTAAAVCPFIFITTPTKLSTSHEQHVTKALCDAQP